MKLCNLAKPFFIGSFFWFLSCLSPLQALVFYSTADPSYNTTAPTGSLVNSGWQWVGYWGSFQGAPIDAHHFLAANHVGGNVGDAFTFQGVAYTTVRSFVDSTSDLRVWEVREAFPTWAPLYRASTEVGRGLIVFGRGVTRGTEVRTTVSGTGVAVGSLAGWQWAGTDGKLRWGQNTVVSTVANASFGEQLYATFDQSGGANECHLGIYDSSAPVFINDGTSWKLAGVAGLVDAYFNTTNSGSGFNAFLFDVRGLYYGNSSAWTPVSSSSPVPSGFYATRVSVHASWIDSVLATPLTAAVTLGNLGQTYDGSSHAIGVATNPTGLAVSVTYAGATTAPVDAGSYAVLATVTSSGYSGSASGTLTVAKASQTISFAALSPATAGDPAFTLSATATSGLPVTYTSSNATVATVSGSAVTIVNPGATTITADQAGNTNFYGAPSVSQTLTVDAAQTIPQSSDVPLGTPLTISVFALLLFVTGSLQLQRSTHRRG
jgi:hypothetical protein